MTGLRALDRKRLRDLARTWGQGLTIALVIACGISSFVAMRTAYESITAARDRDYAERRFADAFVHLNCAPEDLAGRLERIPGVARVHSRVVGALRMPLESLPEPATGLVISLPPDGEPPLDALSVSEGRLPEPGRVDEVVVLEVFARAHGLRPGMRLPAVANGLWRELRVVGLATSPEFIFAVGAGEIMSDERRFGVLWMDRRAVAPLFRMEGSFNDVLLALQPGADPRPVLADVRRVLAPYGVVSATARDLHPSNRMLESEFSQLRTYAVIAPLIFLGVAAFLVNVVMARMLQLERGSIATLKAVGHYTHEIVSHYLGYAAAIVSAGAVLGLGLGWLLGQGMLALYAPYFHFQSLPFRFSPGVVVVALTISVLAGLTGAIGAVWRAARRPPAETMMPEAPASYRRTWIEAMGLLRILSPGGRMVARQLLRRPLRTLLSALGIALGTGVIVTARSTYDAVDQLLDLQFVQAQREDAEVRFRTPLPETVVREIAGLEGVMQVQALRGAPVRLTHDQLARDAGLVAHGEAEHPLRRTATFPTAPERFPPRGVVLGRKLADVLDVAPGERVRMEVLDGDRRVLDTLVAGTRPDVIGLMLYAGLPAAQEMLGEEGNLSSVAIRFEGPEARARALRRINTFPTVAGITRRQEALDVLTSQMEYIDVTALILTIFGAVIAFGVVYNQARIALSTRSRDLASFRVLGFTRGEIRDMLLGELAVYVVLGTPLGLLFGRGLTSLIMSTVDPEIFRLPAVLSAATYAFAALITLAATAVSALLVARKLDQLDLVGVLKARE